MEGHRKIELQAPDDLAYLLANVRRAAAARLDEAFPPVEGANAGGEGDELRTRIEELVNEVCLYFISFFVFHPNSSIGRRDCASCSIPQYIYIHVASSYLGIGRASTSALLHTGRWHAGEWVGYSWAMWVYNLH